MSALTACAFCGRENEPASRFCIDCGKPMSASAARTVSSSNTGSSVGRDSAAGSTSPSARMPRPGEPVQDQAARAAPGRSIRTLPFCGHCGTRVGAPEATGRCDGCGAAYLTGIDLFCAQCGARVGKRVEQGDAGPSARSARRSREHGPRLALLDDEGHPSANYVLERGEAVVGRGDADIRFDDVYLSPLHARFELRDGALWIRDLGSRNGTWGFIEEPTRLADGDVMLIGLAARALPPARLSRARTRRRPTRRAAWARLIPSADVAVLEQLRADGSVRDSFHLSPARTVLLGRESGDWVFPYDPTMSGRHAEIRSRGRGVLRARRGQPQRRRPRGPWRACRSRTGQRILVGDQILRVESISVSALKVCPTCGTEYPANERFCPRDGTALRSQGGGDATWSARSSPTGITCSGSSAKAAWARCTWPST